VKCPYDAALIKSTDDVLLRERKAEENKPTEGAVKFLGDAAKKPAASFGTCIESQLFTKGSPRSFARP